MKLNGWIGNVSSMKIEMWHRYAYGYEWYWDVTAKLRCLLYGIIVENILCTTCFIIFLTYIAIAFISLFCYYTTEKKDNVFMEVSVFIVVKFISLPSSVIAFVESISLCKSDKEKY